MSVKYRILAGISLMTLILDQITKLIILKYVTYQAQFEVIPKVLNITHVWNRGAAFSLFSDWNAYVFVLISIIAVGVILYYFKTIEEDQRYVIYGLSSILGGALGNFMDRARLSHVVDFVDVHLGELFHWPAFNIADVSITIGVGWLILDMFKNKREKPSHP